MAGPFTVMIAAARSGKCIAHRDQQRVPPRLVEVGQHRAAPDQVERAAQVGRIGSRLDHHRGRAEHIGTEPRRVRIDVAGKHLGIRVARPQHAQDAPVPASEVEQPPDRRRVPAAALLDQMHGLDGAEQVGGGRPLGHLVPRRDRAADPVRWNAEVGEQRDRAQITLAHHADNLTVVHHREAVHGLAQHRLAGRRGVVVRVEGCVCARQRRDGAVGWSPAWPRAARAFPPAGRRLCAPAQWKERSPHEPDGVGKQFLLAHEVITGHIASRTR